MENVVRVADAAQQATMESLMGARRQMESGAAVPDLLLQAQAKGQILYAIDTQGALARISLALVRGGRLLARVAAYSHGEVVFARPVLVLSVGCAPSRTNATTKHQARAESWVAAALVVPWTADRQNVFASLGPVLRVASAITSAPRIRATLAAARSRAPLLRMPFARMVNACAAQTIVPPMGTATKEKLSKIFGRIRQWIDSPSPRCQRSTSAHFQI